jgi:hypothetical protein
VREFCAAIISQADGRLHDEAPSGQEDAWSNTVATIVGPDGVGGIVITWRDFGTKPAKYPKPIDEVVFMCDGKIETEITLKIFSLTPNGPTLEDPSARESLEKMERTLVNYAGILAQLIPSLVFYDRSGAIYSATEMKTLGAQQKQRDESWGFRLAHALKLRAIQDARYKKPSKRGLGVRLLGQLRWIFFYVRFFLTHFDTPERALRKAQQRKTE